MNFNFSPIGLVHSCYKQKFGIPRQAGLSPSASAMIEILEPYNRIEAFEELETSSHIWVQFVFHGNQRQSWKPKVKAPRLGGNKTIGVFATRSPVRPNPIGLSAVKLQRIEQSRKGLFLHILGGDFLHGTPVLDIKPYVPYCDSIAEASNDFASEQPELFDVKFDEDVLPDILMVEIPNFADLIIETLRINPAPQYLDASDEKVFVVQLHNYDIEWVLQEGRIIRVRNIRPL